MSTFMYRMTEENLYCFYRDNSITAEQMKLVYRTACRLQEYIPQEMPWEDVIQYGLVGLIKALNKYEAGKGGLNRFAGFYIYGNMIEGIFQFRGVKRYRTSERLTLKQLQEKESAIQETKEEYCQEVAEESGFERIDERLSLRQALMKLDPDERDLIEAYYYKQQSWTEYAQEKFVNVEWVYLLHRRSLKKLRKWLEC